MNKSQTKYYNTSKKMYSSLFFLLETKPFETISVKELCDHANINRSTFYSHYNSMLELLDDAKKYVIEKFFKNFKKNLLSDVIEESENEKYTISNYIIPYLTFVKSNQAIFKVFVENLQTFNADEYFDHLVNSVFIPILTKKGVSDKLAIKYISKYYLNGVTAIVMDWIKTGCIEDITYIANIIMICNKYTIM